MAEQEKKKRTNWKKKFQDLEEKYNEDTYVLKGQVNSLQKENKTLDATIDSQLLGSKELKDTVDYVVKSLKTIKIKESWNPFKTVQIYRKEIKYLSEKLSDKL